MKVGGQTPQLSTVLWGPGINSQPWRAGTTTKPYLTYRPARLHRSAESISGLLKTLTNSGSASNSSLLRMRLENRVFI
jgi:hypothetical protein